jgi:hypothetical protein
MNLETKLSETQIDAANGFRQHLKKRELSYAALVALHEKLPGIEPEICLLKSEAVNAMYGTNVLAILSMAERGRVVPFPNKPDPKPDADGQI